MFKEFADSSIEILLDRLLNRQSFVESIKQNGFFFVMLHLLILYPWLAIKLDISSPSLHFAELVLINGLLINYKKFSKDCPSLRIIIFISVFQIALYLFQALFSFAIITCILTPIITLFDHKNHAWYIVGCIMEIIKINFFYMDAFRDMLLDDQSTLIAQRITFASTEAMLTVPILYLIIYKYHCAVVTKKTKETAKEIRSENIIETLRKNLQGKDSFIYSLSHEVRNPLNVVLGSIGLAYEETTEDNIRETLKSAKVCGELLLNLINNVLDAGKAEMENLEISPINCNTEDFFEKVWQSCREIIINKGLDANLVGLSTIPQFLKLDPHRLTQILFNLISNASKFTKAGTITLKFTWQMDMIATMASFDIYHDEDELVMGEESVSLKFKDKKPIKPNRRIKATDSQTQGIESFVEKYGVLRIEVIDTGPGMTNEAQEQLFKKFSQVSSSSQEKNKGTGLGLWISKSIVEKMGGEIKVKSVEGKGSTFTVKVPTSTCPSLSQSMPNNKLVRHAMNVVQIKAMIIDDNFDITLVQSHIKSLGNNIQIVYSGENTKDALSFYANFRKNDSLDVILINYEMQSPLKPLDFIKELRELEEKQDDIATYIALVGNLGERETMECSNKLGPYKVNHIMRKPIHKQGLTDMFREYSLFKARALSKTYLHQRTVLVVDDDRFNLNLICKMLNKSSIKTIQANNGLEALETFQKNAGKIETILMDGEMPIMDGWEATKAIRRFCEEKGMKMPKIFGLTGHRDQDTERRCKEAGMCEMLNKPITYEELIKAITLSF